MLTAKVILDKFGNDGRLLERREQQSRCFIKGFLELLYLAHGQIAADAYSIPNIDLEPVPCDGVGYDGGELNRLYSPRLIIGAPPGLCCLNYRYKTNESKSILLGVDVGVQAGIGTTAVTPTDRRLEQRIGHGRRPPDGAPLVFESYTAGDTVDYELYGTKWASQPFMPPISHSISSVRVKIWKEGAPGDLTVEIRPVRESTTDDVWPGTVVLATGTIAEGSIPADPGDWVECTFASPVDLYAGHRYFIVMHCGGDSGNSVHWRYDTAATYMRAYDPHWEDRFTYRVTSADSGATWSDTFGDCFMFEEKGQSVGEFDVGGCELVGLTFSDPNGEFTIRRYFTNNCGQSITVNEVGIVSTGEDNSEAFTWLVLIAHDIVTPGVAVADAELLRVTYVPQITV